MTENITPPISGQRAHVLELPVPGSVGTGLRRRATEVEAAPLGAQTPATGGLSAGTRLAYGLGQTAVGFKTRAFDSFLFFYYNQVLGLPGTLVGLAIFIVLSVDALSDPLIGAISDNWRSRLGRRHPFLYGGALPLALAFYLTFAPPTALDGRRLFVWLLLFALLARTAMTLVYVPLMALGAELSDDASERMSLVAWRYAFGLGGQASLVLAGFTLFFAPSSEFPNGHLDPAAYPRLGVAIAAAMLVVVWGSAAGTHHRIPLLPGRGPSPQRRAFDLTSWWTDLRNALSNRSFRAVFLTSSTYSVTRGAQLALGVHVLTYFWRMPPSQIQLAVLARLLGVALGLPLGRAAGRWLEKRTLMAGGIWWFFVVGTTPVLLRLLGWFPSDADPWTLRLVVLCNVLAGLGGGAALVANGSMLADISDEHELEHGVRREGMLFGAEAFAEKASSGAGLLLAGLAIDLIRFPTEAASGEVPASTVTQLGWIYGPVLLLFALLSTLFLRGYHLDRERHRGILGRLATLRAGAGRLTAAAVPSSDAAS